MSHSPTPNRRLLIIDDNRAIHEDYRKILAPAPTGPAIDDLEASFFGDAAPVSERPGFEIDSAYQGEEGIAMLRAAVAEGRPYAVAFVDVRMPPGIDGVETTLRLWELSPELQVVICTAYSDHSWEDMLARLGSTERLLVLKKPFAAVEAQQLAAALTDKWTLTLQARQKLSETERLVAERTRELEVANQHLREEMQQRERTEAHLRRTQRLESIGTLASGIAHDLNNLLSPIIMAAPLLRLELSPGEREELINTVESSAVRAAGVVNQVTMFARGAEGDRTLVQPNYLLQEIARMAKETFPRSIQIRSAFDKGLPLIEVDSTQLHQALLNLTLNARDAMPEGGTLHLSATESVLDDEAAVRIPGARAGAFLRLAVADTGTGMSGEVLEKIFDPFFTTKAIGKGSGLGLSVVAGIVQSHGGFMAVRSEPGAGTECAIYLPMETEVTAPAPLPNDPSMGQGELILVVDDEPGLRETTQQILIHHGYRAVVAGNGEEAVGIYAREGHDISAVLTDVMMPVMDGVALCRRLRELRPGLRIIAATGEADETKRQALRQLDVPICLAKPFSMARLLGVIRDTLAVPMLS